MARILVVDDEPLVRAFIRSTLESLDHDVAELPDGKNVSRLHAETPVDLVITDVFMPGRNGLQTIFDLHQMSPDLPIIAISGGGSGRNAASGADMLRTAAHIGACHVLEKPFGMKRLRDLVNSILDEKHATLAATPSDS
jgi:DNA-binding NtrC family response regulator